MGNLAAGLFIFCCCLFFLPGIHLTKQIILQVDLRPTYWRMRRSIKVGRNFKFFASVKLGTLFLVKLNGSLWCQTMCAGAFPLYAKELVKLIPVVNFTNILSAAFAPISLHQKVQTWNVSTAKLLKRLSYKKDACRMLVKLIRGIHLKTNHLDKKRGKHYVLIYCEVLHSCVPHFLAIIC